MSISELKHSQLTGSIIGAAMKVHSTLGNGFPEYIYERALVIELKKLGLRCEQQQEKTILYDGIQIGKRRLDIIVEDTVILELKTRKDWYRSALNQILSYLRVFQIEVGLVLNFSGNSLEFKRFILTKRTE